MARNEAEFRDQIADILKQQGFTVSTEYKLPEGRIDILAIRKNLKCGIEVKLDRRGIADDIVKCWKLLKVPELDELYVAAPDALLSEENSIHAKDLGVGILSVTGPKLNWIIRSSRLKPAKLSAGGSSYNHEEVCLGNVFDIYWHVANHGQKIARDLEMYFTPAGPFVKAPNKKTRFQRASLPPGEDWKETFKIKVKRNVKQGVYPLHFSATSVGIERISWKLDLTIK